MGPGTRTVRILGGFSAYGIPLFGVVAGTIAGADLVQLGATVSHAPFGRLVGMLGGVAIYAAIAAGSAHARTRRAAAMVTVAMSLVPALVLVAWGVGLPVPTTPDRILVGIACLQWFAAALAVVTLRGNAPAERAVPPE